METVNSFRKKAPSQMFDWVLNTPLASLGCVSYLAISMVIATLASCDQVILKSVCMYVFSMSASASSSLKQNLEKSYILGKLMKLNA